VFFIVKTIVTHFNPDLDAVCSIWLLKKFYPEFLHAEVQFVAAGNTWQGMDVDSDPNVIHVDTGHGILDHHQEDEKNTCSARLSLEFLKSKGIEGDEALDRLVEVVNEIDHFREVYWPNPGADRYEFCLEAMLDGWKLLYQGQDLRFIDWGLDCLDGLYRNLQNKVWAEGEIQTVGKEFTTRFGKGIAVETMNDDILHVGQKMGYMIAVRLDPKKHYLRIKAVPPHQKELCAGDCHCKEHSKGNCCCNMANVDIDLGKALAEFKKMDSSATWYLHPDHRQLLNGSTKNSEMRPTKLTLEEVIGVLSKI